MVDFAQWRNGVDTQLICGALVALIGLIVIGVLHTKNVKGSILWGIVAATVVGIPLGVTKLSAFDLDLSAKFRDFGEVSLFKMDVAGLFEGKSVTDAIFTIIMLVLSFSLVNMFDSMGTLMGAWTPVRPDRRERRSDSYAGSTDGGCDFHSSRSISGYFYRNDCSGIQRRHCSRRTE